MSSGEPTIFNDEGFSGNTSNLDVDAFENFFKQNFVPSCSFCQFKFGFDAELAKEVVHTAFIKLWENRHSISTDSSVKSYMFKIIVNNSLDVIKQEKTKQKYSRYFLQNFAEAYDGADINSTDFKQLSRAIQHAIAELPDQMRRIFELSRYEGLKYSAIADQLTISVKTVETQMSRALAKLREKLGHYLVVFVSFMLALKFL